MKFIVERTRGELLPKYSILKEYKLNLINDCEGEIEICSLQEMVDFTNKISCEIILQGNEIELYDDYRE